jgi:hypothetical protein
VEDILHSKAEACLSIIIHEISWIGQMIEQEISVVVACKPTWQGMRANQSAGTPAQTLMLNCWWCLD